MRWRGQDILYNERVTIAPPYRSEDCSATKDDQALETVKKYVDNVRNKIANRAAKATSVSEEGQRKGG